MLYFLDTEFIPQTLDLISVGIVAEDGREYYAISKDCHFRDADEWVKVNVIQVLPPRDTQPWKYESGIRPEILRFCDLLKYGTPEFWTDCGAFDFVIMSRLFGGFDSWPARWPYYFGDVQQWADQLGVPLPKQEEGQHNALADARHVRACYLNLNDVIA